jgi:hypothetical protein
MLIITLFSKPMLQRLQSEREREFKLIQVNTCTYYYINNQAYRCTLNTNYDKKLEGHLDIYKT